VSNLLAQEPKYTKKCFLVNLDTSDYKSYPNKKGNEQIFLKIRPEIWDTDDKNTTHVKFGEEAIVLIEGPYLEGKKNGVFVAYLIDCNDRNLRYKIWEQTYLNDKLNGEWRTYNLRGTIIQIKRFENDSLNGISRDYWIDGKSIMSEKEYFNGSNNYIKRKYYLNGKISEEMTFSMGQANGVTKRYYENGSLMEKAMFKDGHYEGLREYYYPSGLLWLSNVYKEGKPWEIIANYDTKGQKREPGTLKNGSGTIIYYNDDDSIREVQTYADGRLVNK
jgi:antitoxin component YwqK of YwqJK toxin-antitoxin module